MLKNHITHLSPLLLDPSGPISDLFAKIKVQSLSYPRLHFLPTSDFEKAQFLNSAFSSFFTVDSSPAAPHLNPTTECPDDVFCSSLDIENLIAALPHNEDNITPFLLKATASSISYPLSFIFNQLVSTGSFPSSWKHSIIVPIPKSSPPSAAPSDYGPISMLSIVSKLLEKHIANILVDFLYSNSLISRNQFGFLPSRSTADALIAATQAIHSSLDHSTAVCGVFLDIRKAFDSVSHSRLLHKLSSIGLPSHLYSWFHSYLANRTQSVTVGNSVSSTLPVLSGVPQGSILGPLLFILYINDIPDLDPEFLSRMFIYADDILLLHPISSTSDIFSVNSQLQAINLRLSEKSLKLKY